MAERWAV